MPDPEVLTAAEAAVMLGVNRRTVARWDGTGKLTVGRTPGGARRYLRAEVETLAGCAEPGSC